MAGRVPKSSQIAIALTLSCGLLEAHAGQGLQQIFEPVVTPASPTSADHVVYTALWTGCGALLPPTIVRTANDIAVFQPIFEFCGIPAGGSVRYDLGLFPPGSYRVHMISSDCVEGEPDTCVPLVNPEDVSFEVSAAPAPVPAMGRLSELLLGLLTIYVAMRSKDSFAGTLKLGPGCTFPRPSGAGARTDSNG